MIRIALAAVVVAASTAVPASCNPGATGTYQTESSSGWYVIGGFDHDPNAVAVISQRDCTDDSHSCPTTYVIECGQGRDTNGDPARWKDQPITAAQAQRQYTAGSPCPTYGQ